MDSSVDGEKHPASVEGPAGQMRDHRKSHPTQVLIDLDNLAHNMRLLERLAGGRPLWPAIKANAYGHGALIIGRHLASLGYGTLCVAHSSEAVHLLAHGLQARFIVLSPGLPENMAEIVAYGLEPFVCDLAQVAALSVAARRTNRIIDVHLKVDTGMGRVGIPPGAVASFLAACEAHPLVRVKGIASHFPKADETDKAFSRHQIDLFQTVRDAAGAFAVPYFHMANSAGIFDLPEAHFNAVRPGIAIYGLKPSADIVNEQVNELKPVLTLKTRITFLKDVAAGTGLSYGHRYVAPGRSHIATIPLGYGDGLSRGLSNRLEVLIQGQRCHQVGRICMDQCLVDVTPLKGQVALGDEVVVIGNQGNEAIRADELAAKIDTINYEIVTQLADRLPRIAVTARPHRPASGPPGSLPS